MKNILLISILLILQAGCATQPSDNTSAKMLVNFADLANEITVEHEVVETTAATKNLPGDNATD